MLALVNFGFIFDPVFTPLAESSSRLIAPVSIFKSISLVKSINGLSTFYPDKAEIST